jgi:hypothetical protein
MRVAHGYCDSRMPEQLLNCHAVEEFLESDDPCGSSDEKLNPARVARYVRLFLLCNPHLARVCAYRARKHLLAH